MTTGYWLNTATKFLQSKNVTSARLDALILLEDVTKINRAKLLAEPDTEIREAAVAHLQKLLRRRARHEPLAYIRGWAEFYGRNFVISPAVLVPRPESETMIELLKELDLDHLKDAQGHLKVQLADVGAGSGALGITARKELPGVSVDLLELDLAALKIAKINVDLFTLNMNIIKSDLLAGSTTNYDILVCNLPYVPDGYPINQAASHEPKIALFAGTDGLNLYRRLFQQLQARDLKPLYVLTEALPEQHHALASYARQHGYVQAQKQDFIQLFERAN